jgi:hypothetical protein
MYICCCCVVVFFAFRLGYFQLEEVAYTQAALTDRITKHYVQQVWKKDVAGKNIL